jgi:putative DNA primase/helicase
MSPEENLDALGVRRLPPTPLSDEAVKPKSVADVSGESKPSATLPAELCSEPADPDDNKTSEPLARLAAGDIAPFLEIAKSDPGFPFEPDAITALSRLARDSRADFERLRSKLKTDTQVRLPALEAEMKAEAARSNDDTVNRSGQLIEYDEIDPWDEPVEGAGLLSALAQALDDYVIMDARQRDAVALWTVFTHAHDLGDFAPILVFSSPTKRCGKTRLQEVLARVVPRPQTMSGVSAAALARLIEEHRPTLLVDEFDAIAKSSGEMAESLRGLLNSSFNRSGACVLKTVPLPGGGWEVRKFSTWTPVCVAGIGQVPDTVADRSVIIRLERKLHAQTVKRLRARDGAELHELARKIARFVADNDRRLRHDQPDVPNELNDRARDAWEPLIAIADIAGGEWPERARNAATALAGIYEVEAADGDVRQTLLGDIRDIFACEFPKDHSDQSDRYGPRLATQRLLEELHAFEERSWSAWGRARKPMTDVALARLLKAYGIRSGSVRLDDGSTPKGYYLRSFQEAFGRYLAPISSPSVASGATPPQCPENLRKVRIFQPPHARLVAAWEMP